MPTEFIVFLRKDTLNFIGLVTQMFPVSDVKMTLLAELFLTKLLQILFVFNLIFSIHSVYGLNFDILIFHLHVSILMQFNPWSFP